MTLKISKFRNEYEEREFRAARGSTEYFDWSEGKRVALSELRPSTDPRAKPSAAYKD